MKSRIAIVAVSLSIALSFSNGRADEFYKDKTIHFVVGAPAGGGYDTYARAVARYLGKHLPGNPTMVVDNMDGAGSLIAANYLYNKAEPDGLTIGVWISGQIIRQALGDRGPRFDGRKFGWIGAPSKGSPTCAIMAFTGMKTWDDVLHSKRPIRMGGVRAGTAYDDAPTILNNVAGTKFEVITGYKGTSPIRIALQSREVEGACLGWESMRVSDRAMLDANGDEKLIPFITHKRLEDPEVKDLPLFTEVIKGKDNLATYNTWAASYEFQRPFSVPPKTPPERLQLLRKAFAETLRDTEFLAEAKKMKLDVEPVSGEDIDGYVKQIYSMSDTVKRNLAFLVKSTKKRTN
ncbi:MAG TPA: tripartite tricarboxylate transporter substrate-binding protein [Candidatus Binatia bacterium]|jgi:tripartite-type tricarboxylate transporter receptor subunit TctC|nr:tripartite tricarboxylate transporter substrate-binding protein [Candidatus Binatia bacterium]